MATPNPFRPTFGSVPHTLAGRDEVLARISATFGLIEGDPDATAVVIGHRGTGKTVLLNKAVLAARERRWAAVSVSATDGPLEEAVIEAVAASQIARSRGPRIGQLTGIQALGFGLSWSPPPHGSNPSLRYILTDFADQAARSGVGMLIALDEMQHLSRGEARRFASALQHVIRNEGHSVVFLGAGLSVIETTILSDPGMTFFGRCARIPIGPLDDAEARRAIREPLRDAGIRIEAAALDEAVAAARGYPFMLQQVGYQTWRSTSDWSSPVTVATVRAGISLAQEAMVNQVLKPDWARLSPLEHRALVAMSHDDGPTRTSDLRARLRMTSGTWATYRRRLIDAGVIVAPHRGWIDFAHAPMRSWVRTVALDSPEEIDTHYERPPNLRDRIADALEIDRRASYASIGRAVGAHRSYVRQIALVERLAR
ncbi:ATP-binding protein [Candidatus Spongiisocius sp.]|uniref:ATP-binding protein n=1 Tax=Candidatus Spongiisocius sp. TaxID=3101273 RepID=UPI003B5B3338